MKNINILAYLVLVLFLSSCFSASNHMSLKSEGYGKEFSINSSMPDKEFIERVELALVRQEGFNNSIVKMKSEKLKRVVFNHDVSYGNYSSLLSWASCDYCYVNVQTEVIRVSNNKAIIKHSRFVPHRTDRGVRPMIRETLVSEVKKKLDNLDARLEDMLLNNYIYSNQQKNDYPKLSWPPPLASAMDRLPNDFFKGAKTLDDIDKKISNSLVNSGYSDNSYYSIPNGFAIATRMEQTTEDGIPRLSPNRWSYKIKPLEALSLKSYMKALFTANIGYYRVVVFSISSKPFVQLSKNTSFDQVKSLSYKGASQIRNSIKGNPYTSDYIVTAHIYFFEKPEFGEPKFIIPSSLTGREHLIQSKIFENIKN